ncbi:alpha/beta fold hydrolase [Aquabacterium sp. CECT 9606]|uniref:alpha/beta fold hydrolase n=1 Tax=Aquabacterium sp. CECT 9606 TaxID=2845822 RepID=UPI001E6135C6|nr:alpha/beta hydrolase [Aquabacterium sp. CECT 9606]CAH0353034.1 Putative aminoacrylate hydrolase RutD [Aquabacterium sp. CECT 9606]
MTGPTHVPETWILLRGLTREQRHWGDFPGLLAAELPGARIVPLDLAGNGRLCALPSPATVPDMAEQCRAELARQGIAPPYHVLAMSLGAMVTTAWALAHPHEIQGCVLINTSMRPFSPFYRRLRPRNYPLMLKLALLGGMARQWEEAIMAITTHHPPQREQRLRDWIAYRDECPVSRANALRQLWAAARYTAPMEGPSVRTLILSSTQDGLVAPQCSRQLAACWNTDFADHPSAGHDLPLDDGLWVASQVKKWHDAGSSH